MSTATDETMTWYSLSASAAAVTAPPSAPARRSTIQYPASTVPTPASTLKARNPTKLAPKRTDPRWMKYAGSTGWVTPRRGR
jgi:hypothetical protein